jgi:hypothetical protein
MKAQRASLSILGVPDLERRAMVSAIGATSATLAAEFNWTKPEQSDILIVDITNDEARAHASALSERNNPIVISYAAHASGPTADLTRPIRVQSLIGVMRSALSTASERAAASAALTKTGRFYRPREAAPQNAAANPSEAKTEGKPVRTYRGATY